VVLAPKRDIERSFLVLALLFLLTSEGRWFIYHEKATEFNKFSSELRKCPQRRLRSKLIKLSKGKLF
jgi:hypothetical protein